MQPPFVCQPALFAEPGHAPDRTAQFPNRHWVRPTWAGQDRAPDVSRAASYPDHARTGRCRLQPFTNRKAASGTPTVQHLLQPARSWVQLDCRLDAQRDRRRRQLLFMDETGQLRDLTGRNLRHYRRHSANIQAERTEGICATVPGRSATTRSRRTSDCRRRSSN